MLGTSAVVENGSQFLRAFILARILTPADFGLMGMALVVVFTSEALSQTGFYRALVQKQGDPEEDLDTIFVITVLRGLLLYGIAWLIAPLAAGFFSTPEVVRVLRVTALVFPLQAFLNPAFFLLERELSFLRYAVPRLSGMVCDLIGSVLMALALRSVWGMVWGFLLGRTVYVTLSYVVRPYRPALSVRKDRALDLYRYGRHIFRASVVDCFVGQSDRALVGRIVGVDALGLYSFAARLASIPSTGIYHVVYRIAFPVFSRVQQDVRRLREGYLQALGLLSALSLPVAAGFWVTSADLVPVLIGRKWLGMIAPLQVLCIAGAFMGLYQMTRSVLGGVGRPDRAAQGSYLYLVVFILPLYPAIELWGGVGAAWCSTAGAAAGLTYVLWAIIRLTSCTVAALIGALAAPVAGCLVMVLAVSLLRHGVGGGPGALLLAAEVCTGAIVYTAVLAGMDRILGSKLANTLRGMRRALFAGGPQVGSDAGELAR